MTKPKTHGWLALLSLFSSASTLVCCALPVMVVSLAGGAAMVSLTAAFPQLIFLSEHKTTLFAVAAALLLAAGILQWRGRNAPCPIDAAAACQKARRLNALIYAVSVGIFLVGFMTAFILPRLMT